VFGYHKRGWSIYCPVDLGTGTEPFEVLRQIGVIRLQCPMSIVSRHVVIDSQ
jgi:hypothetical protein